jgi:hypothetical protein
MSTKDLLKKNNSCFEEIEIKEKRWGFRCKKSGFKIVFIFQLFSGFRLVLALD